MRKRILIFLAVTLTGVAVPAIAHYWQKPSEDGLKVTLRGLGFIPLTPPSNLLDVGSLYYIDSEVRFFKTICRADQADIEGIVTVSPIPTMQADELRSGQFDTGVKVDLGFLANGSGGKSYVQKVHYSLTDVSVREIPLDKTLLLFDKLIAKPECNHAVSNVMRAGGYVCQGQQVLHATAEFTISNEDSGKIAAETKAKPEDVKDIVKLAIEAQSNQSVVERSGRLFAGSAMHYGISMYPTCLAPPDGRFARVLPQTKFDRFANFVKFQIVEWIWPGGDGKSAVAETTPGTGEGG